MIGGKKKEELSMDLILSKVSEYDIFRFYLGRDFEIGEAVPSPFRKDEHSSLIISKRYGFSHYKFLDYGDDRFKGGVIDFVILLHPGMNYNDALLKIDKDMCLGIKNKAVRDYKRIIADFKPPDQESKNESIVHIIPRAFTNEELSYWNEYHQDISDLKRDRTFAYEKVFLNRKRIARPTGLSFAYLYIDEVTGEERYKIYTPFSEDKGRKFYPNSTKITDIDGWGLDWETCDKLFIAKSRKDYAVIKKVYPYVIGVQNESLGPFTEEVVKRIRNCSKAQYLGYDADNAGRKAALKVTTAFGYRDITIPLHYLPNINDFAGLGRMGLKLVENQLIEKSLI